MAELYFSKIKGDSKEYFALLIFLALIVAWGAYGFWVMFRQGHWVTGMTNQVIWGLPIVSVVYLIGASAGSLIISALAGVFGKEEYKIFSRMAAYLAALMIVGALLDIFLDLGKVEHGMNVIRYFNFSSIFSWNAFLYTSYFALCCIYLLAQMERKDKLVKILAIVAVAWAVLVHSGTGGIIGFIYSMDLWHSPLTAPLFIISAIASGIGIMIPILVLTFRYTNRYLDENLIRGLAKIMGAMIILLLYCFTVENLERGYVPAHAEAIYMSLFDWSQPFPKVFWFIQIFMGMLIPLAILLYPRTWRSVNWLCVAGIIHAIGVFAERYILVVPGLAYPKEVFPPGYEMAHIPPFEYGAPYVPGWPEVALVAGTFALIFLLFLIGLKVFELLPETGEVNEQ
ncbi:NrfD/PsrC family molybdoenzyme membrane anchor subunit [Archaeoglobus veneficus]|uniref:Polysulphide reductase NrfD n=1 Tax=Archaeoglobus veneficus (strain DSM 11195 / SNP6) TaxID=693661 RepID=F2KQF6_ARCVS|nr:NrfD/PsrC family molybdoenzyme membrane anchor subunit [Archaeoglobus veneficus]AEA47689.1 Polysulphide reductase NrfD [Archaeoglobus veneficus SNP6]